MATAGALHAGGRLLVPLRHSPGPTPWSHLRSHLISSRPPSPSPPPPPPRCPPSVAPSRLAAPAFNLECNVVNPYHGYDVDLLLVKSKAMLTFGPEDSLDLLRTLRMASYGLLISGPTLHFWFNFVSKVFPKKDVLNTFKKMFLGQAVYGPIINSVFFSYNAALQGETAPEIIARLKRDLVPTIKSGLIYWPLCDFITFKFVPVHLQPLVSNSFSFLWTIYITYMASLKKADVEVVMTS
ncbi:hypothetical protein EJB05_01431, partial [Eragrostis curvula]